MGTLPKAPDTILGEALFILKSLKELVRLGRPSKLADAKAVLQPSVSLDFDSYFFFLRKNHYLAVERDSSLRLTELGSQVVEGAGTEKFQAQLLEFFSEQGGGEAHTQAMPMAGGMVPDNSLLGNELPQGFSRPRRTMVIDERSSAFPGRSETEKAIPIVGTAPVLAAAPGVPPAPSAALKGADLEGKFTKFESLGNGPLGTVYKGRHNSLGTEVAIKELKDIFGYFSFLQRGEVIKRLKKELCAQAQVRHPCVVAMVEQSTDVARPYFVSELLHESLRNRMDAATEKGLDFKGVARWFLQLAYGLKAAHDVGLTHHNIKPENVLLDAVGNAKWSDFGLSRVIEVDPNKGMPQVFVGTGGMGYMAPELLARSKEVGPAADIYGLGMLLYEMLAGQLPGRRSPMPSEIRKDIPAALDALFDKMTQDRRENRYQDMDAVLNDFYAAFPQENFLKRGDLILYAEKPQSKSVTPKAKKE